MTSRWLRVKEFACQGRRRETQVPSLGQEDPPGGENDNSLQYSCGKIPQPEEHGGLQTVGSQRAGHNRARAQTHARIRSGSHAHIIPLARGAAKVFPLKRPTSPGFHIMTAPPSGFLWKSSPPPSLLALGASGGVWKSSKHCPLQTQLPGVATLPVLNNSALNHILS